VQETNGLREVETRTFRVDRLPFPSLSKQAKQKEEVTITADSIILDKNVLVIKGSVTVNTGDKNESITAAGISMSFAGGIDKMPLIIYNGKIVTGIRSFKAVKAKYRLLSLNAKDGVAKYGSKAKYGALEITRLDDADGIKKDDTAFYSKPLGQRLIL
jgi:hypothetical protein